MRSFICDEQISPRLAKQLRERGFSAAHVCELGLGSADDLEIWRHADAAASIILTKDRDIATLAIAFPGPPVIWIRMGNCSTLRLAERLLTALPRLLGQIDSGARLIELR